MGIKPLTRRPRKIRSPISDSQNSQLLFRFVTFFLTMITTARKFYVKKEKNPQFFHSWA